MYNLHEAYFDVYYDLNEAPFNDKGEFIRGDGEEAPERPELPASMKGRRAVPAHGPPRRALELPRRRDRQGPTEVQAV